MKKNKIKSIVCLLLILAPIAMKSQQIKADTIKDEPKPTTITILTSNPPISPMDYTGQDPRG